MNEAHPPTGAAPATPASAAIERLLRRSLLMLTRAGATVQDRLDFADLADAVDAPAIAALVRDTALLRQGFGAGPAIDGEPQGSIERAVSQLRDLMGHELADAPAEPAEALDAAAACAALRGILEAPLDRPAEARLAGLLAAWRALADAAPAHGGSRVDAALSDLAAAFAAWELQAFLRRNHMLAFAPYGSAALLHRAARLGAGGLGPYFSGIGNIVRGSQDVLGLIALAAGEQAAASVERWVVPLAHGLPEATTVDLVDDLADLGMIGALRGLVAVTISQPERIGLIRHLRDAALDLGDDALALSAQQEVLTRAPYDAIEWRCMASMLVTNGDSPAAEAALAYALKLAPSDEHTAFQLAALQAGDPSGLILDGGFATPPARKRMRFARRAA